MAALGKRGKESMDKGGSSRTAIVTAMLRGAHYILDGEPKILHDLIRPRLRGLPK